MDRSRDQAPSALGRVFVIVVYVHRGVSRDVVPDGRTEKTARWLSVGTLNN